jgi:hypothetical protein
MKKFTSVGELHWEAAEQQRRETISARVAGSVVSSADFSPQYLDLLAQSRKKEATDAEQTCAVVVMLLAMTQERDGDFPVAEGPAA